MSKPDSYMPFYGPKFEQAMKGQPHYIFSGYLQAVIYYWFHANCEGLKDNDEFLRKVCGQEKDEWPACREVLFSGDDEFFSLGTDGKWHQKFQDGLWRRQEVSYAKAVTRGRIGADARWSKDK